MTFRQVLEALGTLSDEELRSIVRLIDILLEKPACPAAPKAEGGVKSTPE